MPAASPVDPSSERERARLVDHLLASGHLRPGPVAEAMRDLAREEFVPTAAREDAYLDQPLPIGAGQTISAPHMVAIMSEALEVRPGFRILEVGTGSGYQAAILSRLVGTSGSIVTIERVRELAQAARKALASVGADNVKVVVGDGSLGHAAAAPYDRIVVTAAAPKLPPPLIEQLAPDGILLTPVGGRVCALIRARQTPHGLREEDLGACAFVPLKGAHGQGFRFFGS